MSDTTDLLPYDRYGISPARVIEAAAEVWCEPAEVEGEKLHNDGVLAVVRELLRLNSHDDEAIRKVILAQHSWNTRP